MWSKGREAVGSPAGRVGSGSESGFRSPIVAPRASHGSNPASPASATAPPVARTNALRVHPLDPVTFSEL